MKSSRESYGIMGLFAVHTFEENHCGTIHSSGQSVKSTSPQKVVTFV